MPEWPETQTLELALDDGWLTVMLARPESRNALSAEMVAELTAVVEAVRGDRSVRGVTLRGKGGTFCAGGDLKAFQAAHAGAVTEAELRDMSRRAGALLHAVDALPQVTLMLVEGAAMAGGLGLACAGDFVAATADTNFALTETMLGIPPAQIAPLVVARTGPAAARRIMLTGHRFGADEAARLGIVDEVVPNAAALDAFESELRERVMRCAPGANAVTKALVADAMRLSREAMVERAAEAFAACLAGDEGREGVAAFLEKRKPAWAR